MKSEGRCRGVSIVSPESKGLKKRESGQTEQRAADSKNLLAKNSETHDQFSPILQCQIAYCIPLPRE